MPIGLTMPLVQSSSALGVFASTNTEMEATYYNFKALLLTNWGERPNHFYLGCNLAEFLFSQQSNETKELIIQRIESQVSDWLPYVSVRKIDVTFTDDHKIKIRVEFTMNGRQVMDNVIEVAVFSQGG